MANFGMEKISKKQRIKIEENIQRDIKIDGLLRNMDWTPLHFWSNDVKKYLDFCISEIEDTIHEINMLDE